MDYGPKYRRMQNQFVTERELQKEQWIKGFIKKRKKKKFP